MAEAAVRGHALAVGGAEAAGLADAVARPVPAGEVLLAPPEKAEEPREDLEGPGTGLRVDQAVHRRGLVGGA